jgi:hypothetical protein
VSTAYDYCRLLLLLLVPAQQPPTLKGMASDVALCYVRAATVLHSLLPHIYTCVNIVGVPHLYITKIQYECVCVGVTRIQRHFNICKQNICVLHTLHTVSFNLNSCNHNVYLIKSKYEHLTTECVFTEHHFLYAICNTSPTS